MTKCQISISKRLYAVISLFRRRIISRLHLILNDLILLKAGISVENITIRGVVFISNAGRIELGNNITIRSGPKENNLGDGFVTRLITKENGALHIGNNVGISNSTIICTKSILIGDNVLIGNNTKIWDTDFHSLDPEVRKTTDNEVKNKSIQISDNVFIGANTIILKGVSIGEESVIGAGSVLSCKVPARQIWAGNPACFIRDIE